MAFPLGVVALPCSTGDRPRSRWRGSGPRSASPCRLRRRTAVPQGSRSERRRPGLTAHRDAAPLEAVDAPHRCPRRVGRSELPLEEPAHRPDQPGAALAAQVLVPRWW